MMEIPKETPADVIGAPKDDWDPMQSSDKAVLHWTTTNLGEAVPGIITPLGIAQWQYPGTLTAYRVAYRIGAFSKKELDERTMDPAEFTIRMFYGRVATRLEYMASIGDRMPGTTGAEALASLFGAAPEGMTFDNTAKRYPFIALRLTRTFLEVPKMLATVVPAYQAWWEQRVKEIPSMDREQAVATFAEAVEKFQVAMDTQVTAMIGSFQPMFDTLDRLIAHLGVGDLATLSGGGGAEIDLVTDIWRASRGEITVADIVRRHGFHGPGEGEISSRVWREDPSPLETVVTHYKALPESEHPALREAEKERKRLAMTEEVLAAAPAWQRPGLRRFLALAAKRIPDRGRAKRSFLQTIDIGRMAARRAGEHLVADGVLEERDDVFYLTGEELTGTIPADVKTLVAKRKQRREVYSRIYFRSTEWQGMPDAFEIEQKQLEPSNGHEDDVVSGTGASAGVVEGLVRVVEDPSFQDVEPDEILVAGTTDPSWCSIMYVSSALVVDLGGMLSHAAVVARELEIPCVVNTRNGTSRLHTGDRVRVDGKAGTVEILERA